ncbi:hypothetical protein Q5H93_14445 [Hymenobacter sp. ASUV-10]|uniref:XRE family transcriptional regulator n=1 Tax=Hymenobacter aranciens TaxID=3063996 RepID=A0ABT9BCE4_9BACT|nr:hypothetical protein [Hymenobacter sp. ASUV-10]MDO7875940.1 hypothetical protein [Hymenobacter sp. ASUV-10]
MSTTINQRFAQLIQHLGITKNAFAMSLDKTASVIQHLLDGRNKPGFDLLQRVFEVYPNVSRDWVMLGQGPMLLSGENPPQPQPVAAPKMAAATEAPPAIQPAEPQPTPVAAPEIPSAAAPQLAPETPVPTAAQPAPTPVMLPSVAAAPAASLYADAYVSAALHTQHLQHQLALAELRNQHLLEQQQMLRQMLELAQRTV